LLETQIVTLKLAPGTLLTEKDLAGITGIGRTPVREAVQRLASSGLLQILPRKGLMVTTLRRSDMANILETRRVLERLLVVKACERATPDLRRSLLIMSEHARATGNDPDALLRLFVRIDELLATACDNRNLVLALAPMHSQCRRLWYMYRDEMDLVQAMQSHAALARMVGEGNSAGAIRALDGIIATLEKLVTHLDELS
jgi:DNA-binding GntR family transcriptional regulator